MDNFHKKTFRVNFILKNKESYQSIWGDIDHNIKNGNFFIKCISWYVYFLSNIHNILFHIIHNLAESRLALILIKSELQSRQYICIF